MLSSLGCAWRRLAAIAICAVIAGCAAPDRVAEGPPSSPQQQYWPEPPELPRLSFEATLRSSAGLELESQDDRLRRMFTGQDDRPVTKIVKPGGVAARQGRVFVVDTVGRSVVVFDIPRRKVFRFGWRQPNNLYRPIDVAVDDFGKIYVTDAKLKRVMVFDPLGLFLTAIGRDGDFDRPVGVAVSPDGQRVYVVDRGTVENESHQVVVFNAQGEKLRVIGVRGNAPGQFNAPVAAAVGRDGVLHVLDSGNFRVQMFSAAGDFIREFGSVGNGFGQFARPRGIAVDREGNIFVTDAGFGNFQIFNSDGQLLLGVGELKRIDGRAHYALPAGIAVDDSNRIYVADQYFNKVEVFRRLTEEESRRLAASDVMAKSNREESR